MIHRHHFRNRHVRYSIGFGLVIILFIATVFSAVTVISVFARQDDGLENFASEVKELPEQLAFTVRSLSGDSVRHIPILMYHYVEYVEDSRDTLRKSLDTTPDVFAAQVQTLLNSGYTFITVSDLGDILDAKTEMPLKPVVLTFDDGYGDFYSDVFPILERFNVRATAYLIPGFLDKPNYMTREEVREIVRSGLVEIGSHTVEHISLAGKPDYEVRRQVRDSRRLLEESFGVPVNSFAYPYGSFDQDTIGMVADSGYRTAVTTVTGTAAHRTNRLYLFRLRPQNLVGIGLMDFINRCIASGC